MFQGFIKVADRCTVCDLDLGRHDSGDGPVAFIILIVGFVVVGLALWVEASYRPPYWLHAVLWLPLILVGTLGLMRPLKGILVALHHHHRREEFDDPT